MKLSLDDLKNGNLYLGEKGTLASRIDFAWTIYSNSKFKKNDRRKALNFLIYAFNLNNHKHINKQLIELMAQRESLKKEHPDIVPGKLPRYLQIKSEVEAINRMELLEVNEKSKMKDFNKKTIYFSSIERARHEIVIHNGVFKKDGKIYDSSELESHSKKGFVAFTMNVMGEISVFQHLDMADHIAHSSMNAGKPVIAAGEMKIKKGKLEAITTHSGHYQPSLFNIYRFLQFTSENNVDISNTDVLTFNSVSLSGVKSKQVEIDCDFYKEKMHSTNAKNILNTINTTLDKQIDSIQDDVKSYVSHNLKSLIYHLNLIVTFSSYQETVK